METRICDITKSISETKQNKSATQAIKENDIVIIYDKKVLCHMWRLGRVVDIIPSRDSNIRAAKIKVGKTGATINRPINKLYPLECSMTYDRGHSIKKTLPKEKEKPKLRASFKKNLVGGRGGEC